MKRSAFFTIGAVLLLLTSCNKDIAPGTPSCIRNEIKKHGKNWGVSQVDEFLFQNKLVYAFLPDGDIIADGSTEIKDGGCTTLCHVGGFGGPQINQCNGENFYQQAVLQRTIWKKNK